VRSSGLQAAIAVGVVVSAIACDVTATCILTYGEIEWEAGYYVGWNDLIIEGTLVAIYEGRPRALPKPDAYLYKGQEGRILVKRVVFNKTDMEIAPGDTVLIFHRTEMYNPPKDYYTTTGEYLAPLNPLEIEAGACGYFGLMICADRSLTTGYAFWARNERQNEVDAFISRLSTDYYKTIGSFREHFHDRYGRNPPAKLAFRSFVR
jgi:hypothetical protein